MSWGKKTQEFIMRDVENFARHFFPGHELNVFSSGIHVNGCPFCGHNDCFTLSKRLNGGKCFSCGEKGTFIQLIFKLYHDDKKTAMEALGEFTGIEANLNWTEEDIQVRKGEKRLQEIYRFAVQFYHEQLLADEGALKKQTGKDQAAGERGHTIEGLAAFQVGLSGEYPKLYGQLLANGYTKEEMEKARELIFLPPGYFVYPYWDTSGNLVRLNAKLYKRHCRGKLETTTYDGGRKVTYPVEKCEFSTLDLSKEAKEAHEEEHGHTMNLDYISKGQREEVFFFRPESKRYPYLFEVEGENDVISAWEELQLHPQLKDKFQPGGLGGNPSDETFRSLFLRRYEGVYSCFDNDEAGEGYLDKMNEYAPDVPLWVVSFDEEFNDIDKYLKSEANDHKEFVKWIENATPVETPRFLISRKGREWFLKNRSYSMHAVVKGVSGRGHSKFLEGSLTIYKAGEEDEFFKDEGVLRKFKVGVFEKAKNKFVDQMSTYYLNLDKNGERPSRSFEDLIDIYHINHRKAEIIKQMAYLIHYDMENKEKRMAIAQKRLTEKKYDELLRELNGFANRDIDPNISFPRMRVSQYFNITTGDAFMYFQKRVFEEDTLRVIPFLVSNTKDEIRLDILKRKDEQCLILINNKYELPVEVPVAIASNNHEISLQPMWVKRWIEGNLSEDELKPGFVVEQIEKFLRRFYITTEHVYKLMAIWIYATYYYSLFTAGFPYLFLNGPKGSGKSQFDKLMYLLAFNAKFVLSITDAALFRGIAHYGGTYILDEMEDLTDTKKANESLMATILRGGYSETGKVYRTDRENPNQVEAFSAFCPKAISNIEGLEPVIMERVIPVFTRYVSDVSTSNLDDIELYLDERRGEVHAITSRCALSALTHFKEMYTIYQESSTWKYTGNSRLNQLMRPLLAMAKLCGGDYYQYIVEYYEAEIAPAKEETRSQTIDGILEDILKNISGELTGRPSETCYTNYTQHLYQKPISLNDITRTFTVNCVHLKVFAEEQMPERFFSFKEIRNALKNILSKRDITIDRIRKLTNVNVDENLAKRFNNNLRLRPYNYTMNVDWFLEEQQPDVPEFGNNKPLF